MLVIDRRADTTAYAPGANRSKVQAELDKQGFTHGIWESPAVPALVEVEHLGETTTLGSGVLCIAQTPGRAELLRLLFERVWGVGRDALAVLQ